MKKIFTLFAIATMAVSAQAQEKLIFSAANTYTDNQELTTDNVTLKLGNDQKAASYTISQVTMDADKNAYLADFFQTVTTDDGEKNGVVAINGGNNPKDLKAAGKGSGINCAEGKTIANLPQNGTYYILTTKVAGKVQAGIVLNTNKAFYLIDATNATENAETEKIEVALPDANLHNYVIKDGAGEVVALEDDGDSKGGKIVSEKVNGTLEFDAEAGHTYYFFCTGSKLGFFGYVFTAGGSAGITAAKTVSKDNAIYNLAGQKVVAGYKGIVIKNGQKVVMK